MDIDELLHATARFRSALARFEAELRRQQALAAEPVTYKAQPEYWYTPSGPDTDAVLCEHGFDCEVETCPVCARIEAGESRYDDRG